MDKERVLKEMNLEEKASLCSGASYWKTEEIKRLNIPDIMLTDGPNGLRKQISREDNLGINESVPATCFPSAVSISSSWDNNLIAQMGEVIADECIVEGVSILLGPGVNIKRTPLCGRNFEYFSEDPYLSAELATAYIKSVQAKGVGTSIKHFVANNQEHKRFSVSANVDERTLREIYLASFEKPIVEAKPWTVMNAYNKLNGEYISESKRVLSDILRDEWGYKGVVVTDWGAYNNRVKGLQYRLNLQMPADGGIEDKKIIKSIKECEMDESVLDKSVMDMLALIEKCIDAPPLRNDKLKIDFDKHHEIAREVSAETFVLLKNKNDVLPLSNRAQIAILGEMAEKPRYQGGGSSHVKPTKVTTPLDVLMEKYDAVYEKGYSIDENDNQKNMIKAALKHSEDYKTAVIFAGLPESYESEGYDRVKLDMPENQNRLIDKATEVYERVIVVLANGSPILMPWLDKVDAVLETFLAGQAVGLSVYDVISGNVNPSGKLSETYPLRLEDTPSYLHYPGHKNQVDYREGIFVGYRYYDTVGRDVLFPFGFGMSYTSFEYSNIKVNTTSATDNEKIIISMDVKNTGARFGKEIVQLYVGERNPIVERPLKELKGYFKVGLAPNEVKTVEFELNKRSFAYYDVEMKCWRVESGTFDIFIGASIKDIRGQVAVDIESTLPLKIHYSMYSTLEEIRKHPVGMQFVDKIIKAITNKTNQGEEVMPEEAVIQMLNYMTLRMILGFISIKSVDGLEKYQDNLAQAEAMIELMNAN